MIHDFLRSLSIDHMFFCGTVWLPVTGQCLAIAGEQKAETFNSALTWPTAAYYTLIYKKRMEAKPIWNTFLKTLNLSCYLEY